MLKLSYPSPITITMSKKSEKLSWSTHGGHMFEQNRMGLAQKLQEYHMFREKCCKCV